jgi:hypothetical protein
MNGQDYRQPDSEGHAQGKGWTEMEKYGLEGPIRCINAKVQLET